MSIQFLNRCNCTASDKIVNYSQESINKILSLLFELRHTMLDIIGDDPRETQLMIGRRFMDNDKLVTRIKSNFSEKEFKAQPIEIILDALRNAAATDYWYAYEKQYE